MFRQARSGAVKDELMPLPDLLHTFHGRDLGYLRMVAGLWGIELDAANVRAALPQLTEAMLNPELANEIVGTLPVAAQDAISTLADAAGLIPWSQFVRTYGEVRSMGAAKRDRERPDLNPRTPAEMVWYYGLIGQAFLDMPPEPQQYAYIPADLLSLLEIPQHPAAQAFGRPASPGETARILPASDRVLDHACTLLAALRLGLPADQIPTSGWDIPLDPPSGAVVCRRPVGCQPPAAARTRAPFSGSAATAGAAAAGFGLVEQPYL